MTFAQGFSDPLFFFFLVQKVELSVLPTDVQGSGDGSGQTKKTFHRLWLHFAR